MGSAASADVQVGGFVSLFVVMSLSQFSPHIHRASNIKKVIVRSKRSVATDRVAEM